MASWAAVIVVALWWGHASIADAGLGIGAAPLAGHWEWHPSLGLLPAAAVAAVVVWAGPGLAARLPWHRVPLLAGLAASAWALALAAADGWQRVTEPLTTRHEYEPFAASIADVGSFLDQYVQQLPATPVHVQGHPPGATLVPLGLDRLGLAGAGWLAAIALAGWGLAVAAALVAARSVGGEAAARRAAPALVLLPAAVWAGTSLDALFAGVLAVGVALALLARRRAALAGGAVLGGGLLLTYGGALLLALPGLAYLRRRRPRQIAVLGGAVVVVLVAVAVWTGFWWPDGLQATRAAYARGIAADRPAGYFALAGNPAALALATGPAVAMGVWAMASRWRRADALLPLAGLALVLVAQLSLLSKGEVERIWLPFVPWLALAAPGQHRGWLAVQAGLALLLQATLRSPW